jgi:hypothetical protein
MIKVMAHPVLTLFTPHPHNNHKAKILWSRSLAILLGIFIMGRSFIDIFSGLKPGVLGFASQINPQKVIELTNKERELSGLSDLKFNQQLTDAATAKATDMFAHNYWAHVSPTGVEPWFFITNSNYQYQHAGENLARDFSNPSDVVAAWMASPTHKANILDKRYQDIGIAVMDGYINGVETTLVVQMFGTTSKSASQIAAASVVNTAVASEPDTKIYPATGISPFDASRSWSLAFVIIIIFSLSLDWLFVWRNNIVRVSGKTWAHLTFFVALATILFIIRQGIIL